MNILLSFTILILSWSIDSTDPSVQALITRIFFGTHALITGFSLYMTILIWRNGGSDVLQVKNTYTKDIETYKSWEYDFAKLRDMTLTKIGINAAISLFVASRYGMPFPLLLQCMNNPKALYDSELFKIYILGRPAEGELKRPWAEDSVLPEWVNTLWSQSEADTESMLEKHGASNGKATGGKKKK